MKKKGNKIKINKNKNWKKVPEGTSISEILDDMDFENFENEDMEEGSGEGKNKMVNTRTGKIDGKPKEPTKIPDFIIPIKTSLDPVTNPNGANQYLLDPRQALFWKKYNDPKEKNFGNAYQTALEIGYSDSSASQITTQQWFLERCRRSNMLLKAEHVLAKTLETDHIRKKIGMFGPIVDPVKKEYVYEIDASTFAIKNKVAMFVAERQGKDSGYSTRNELTGKDGKDLPTPILGVDFQKEIDKADETPEGEQK